MKHDARLVSLEEAAKRLNVAKDVVYRMAVWGILPYVWMYGARRFKISDIDACLSSRDVRAQTETA